MATLSPSPRNQFQTSKQQWRAARSIRLLLEKRWLAAVLALMLTGFAAAAAGLMFKTGIGWLGAWRLRLLQIAPATFVLPLLGGVGGLISALLIKHLAPAAEGSGITQVMEFIKGQNVPMGFRVALVKLVTGIVAIGTGFPLGPEGPSVQMGGSVAWQLAKLLKAPSAFLNVIVAAGGGAGIAAVFNAPIGGFLYSIEELLRSARPVVLLVVLVTTFSADTWADVMGLAGLGSQSSGLNDLGFQLEREFSPLVRFLPIDLLYLIGLGIVVGLLAEVYCRYVILMQLHSHRWFGKNLVLRMMSNGFLLGAVFSFLPSEFHDHIALQHAVGEGHVEINNALAIFSIEFCATGLAAASGAPGGLFAPMLTLGGSIGLACGGIVEYLTGHVPTTYVFAGMGAFVAACSRTPITAMFLAFALTKDLLILKPILVTCLASFLVSQALDAHSIYERQIALNHELEYSFGVNKANTKKADGTDILMLTSMPLKPDPRPPSSNENDLNSR